MYNYYNILVKIKPGYRIKYSKEKDLLLKETRGVSFEDVLGLVFEGQVLSDRKHHNPQKYPNQRILVVRVGNYAYAVPYVIDGKKKIVFLKTAYPSREFTKKYLK